MIQTGRKFRSTVEDRFVFLGVATGPAGLITRVDEDTTVDAVMPVQAASALPVIGGLSEVRSGPYVLKIEKPRPVTLFSVGSSYTRAEGRVGKDGTYVTTVVAQTEEAVITENINIPATRAALVSLHGKRDKVAGITPEGSVLEKIRLGRYTAMIELDLDPFIKNPTQASLLSFYRRNAKFRRENYRRFHAPSPEATEVPAYTDGTIVTSIVKRIFWDGEPNPDVTIDNYTMIWKGVGRLILGELLISETSKRLTMIRTMLGSPIEGKATFSEVQTNGHRIP